MSSISYIDTAVTVGKDYDVLFKVLLIGNSGVGKSSIVQHYLESNTPMESQFITTIGEHGGSHSFVNQTLGLFGTFASQSLHSCRRSPTCAHTGARPVQVLILR